MLHLVEGLHVRPESPGLYLVARLVALAAVLALSGATGLPSAAAPAAEHAPAAVGLGAARPAARPCLLLGDINCDGVVDLLAYSLWRQAFGATDCGNPA